MVYYREKNSDQWEHLCAVCGSRRQPGDHHPECDKQTWANQTIGLNPQTKPIPQPIQPIQPHEPLRAQRFNQIIDNINQIGESLKGIQGWDNEPKTALKPPTAADNMPTLSGEELLEALRKALSPFVAPENVPGVATYVAASLEAQITSTEYENLKLAVETDPWEVAHMSARIRNALKNFFNHIDWPAYEPPPF